MAINNIMENPEPVSMPASAPASSTSKPTAAKSRIATFSDFNKDDDEDDESDEEEKPQTYYAGGEKSYD